LRGRPAPPRLACLAVGARVWEGARGRPPLAAPQVNYGAVAFCIAVLAGVLGVLVAVASRLYPRVAV